MKFQNKPGFGSLGSLISRWREGNVPDLMYLDGIAYRIISDHLGSPRLVIGVNDGAVYQRMDYDEFGKILRDTSPDFQPFGFAGGILYGNIGTLDSKGQERHLVGFGARLYDPEIGRWISRDPILFNGGSSNLYTYANNDPVNFIDPSGLSDVEVDRGTGQMYVYPGGPGTYGPPQVFPVGNNTVNPTGDPLTPESHGPAPAGSFPVGPYTPVNGDPNSAYGSGFFPINLPAGPNGQRTGVGIHAGRANRGGPNANTLGCVRTNEAGLDALRRDPPTNIRIGP